MIKKIWNILKRMDTRLRGKLSHHPVLYAVIGGVGIVLFWRGVWHTADDINVSSTISLFLGFTILLITGVFISEFIGNKLIISGLIGEKQLTEKETGEIETEETQIRNLQTTLNKVEKQLSHLEEDMHKK